MVHADPQLSEHTMCRNAKERLTKKNLSTYRQQMKEQAREKEGLVDVRSPLMTDTQSAKTVKPPEGALNDPTPSIEPFA